MARVAEAAGGAARLALEPLLSAVERGAMILAGAPGHQHLALREVEPQLGDRLDALHVEEHRGLHRAGRDAGHALGHGAGTLPQRIRDLAMAGRDDRLHAYLPLSRRPSR